MNESDERYLTAEDAIYDAFFLLLKEKSVDKITVSDVVKKAGIVRSTFYSHYENIPSLVIAAEDKTIDDIFKLMESFHSKNVKDVCRSYFLAICNYTKKNPFLSNLLQTARGDAFFEKAIMMFHQYVTDVSSTSAVSGKSGQETGKQKRIANEILRLPGAAARYTLRTSHWLVLRAFRTTG